MMKKKLPNRKNSLHVSITRVKLDGVVFKKIPPVPKPMKHRKTKLLNALNDGKKNYRIEKIVYTYPLRVSKLMEWCLKKSPRFQPL